MTIFLTIEKNFGFQYVYGILVDLYSNLGTFVFFFYLFVII